MVATDYNFSNETPCSGGNLVHARKRTSYLLRSARQGVFRQNNCHCESRVSSNRFSGCALYFCGNFARKRRQEYYLRKLEVNMSGNSRLETRNVYVHCIRLANSDLCSYFKLQWKHNLLGIDAIISACTPLNESFLRHLTSFSRDYLQGILFKKNVACKRRGEMFKGCKFTICQFLATNNDVRRSQKNYGQFHLLNL